MGWPQWTMAAMYGLVVLGNVASAAVNKTATAGQTTASLLLTGGAATFGIWILHCGGFW